MTAPVMQRLPDEEDEWVVSFSMPAENNVLNLPMANNEGFILKKSLPA